MKWRAQWLEKWLDRLVWFVAIIVTIGFWALLFLGTTLEP